MEWFWRDLRFSVRALVRRPGFTGLIVLVLGLGLGGSMAMFSLVKGVLLDPLDYARSDRLVAVFRHDLDSDQHQNPTSAADFLDWKRQSDTLELMTAAHPWAASLTGREAPIRISGLRASPSLFSMLEAEPLIGSVFRPVVGDAFDPRVVVLGHELWIRQFGGDRSFIGQTLTLDGESYHVIGVMPPGFAFPPFWATEAEFWAPLALTESQEANRRAQFLRVFARLKPGRDVKEARAELATIAERLRADYPETNEYATTNVERLREPVVASVRPALLALLAAVGLVVLVTCANVAQLLLAQALSRRREIAVQLALGAKRAHLVRACLTESLVLAVAGGFVGIFVAFGALAALRHLASESLPRVESVTLDAPVFLAAFLTALVAGALSGAAPAITASRTLLRPSSTSRVADGGRASRVLVVGEVAVALVLLSGAGLLLRSYWQLTHFDPGFRREQLVTTDIPFAGSDYEDPTRQLRLLDAIGSGVAALPGVDAAAFVNHLPIGGDIWQTPFFPDTDVSPDTIPRASYRTVSPRFFDVMGSRLVHGRGFDTRDRAASAPVVVINRTLADRYFPDMTPIGRRLHLGDEDSDDPWRSVVGVVDDLRQWSLTDEVRPEIFFPYSQNPVSWWTTTTLVVRSELEAGAIAGALRGEVGNVDPNLPITEVRTMEGILARDVRQPRLNASVLALFALETIVLAALGVFGLVSHSVDRRKREMGIRAALGAAPGTLTSLMVREGMSLTLTGVVFGLLGALAASQILSSLLFRVQPADPVTFGCVSMLLLAMGLLASYLPARGARSVSPTEALRADS